MPVPINTLALEDSDDNYIRKVRDILERAEKKEKGRL